jgi:hypothetical protein
VEKFFHRGAKVKECGRSRAKGGKLGKIWEKLISGA